VGELLAGNSECHDEGQVVQQLKGRRRPVQFIWIAAGHHSKAVSARLLGNGHGRRLIW
jgi:hypothetical protein